MDPSEDPTQHTVSVRHRTSWVDVFMAVAMGIVVALLAAFTGVMIVVLLIG